MPSLYELTPPLLAMKAARIDSPVSNHQSYTEDLKFFAKHPKSHTYIRAEISGEFDLLMPISDYLQIPRLWLLIVQVAKGVHSVTPIYRGSRFWTYDISDDQSLSIVLIEMARQEGLNAHEFEAFDERVRVKNRKFIEANPAGSKVH